MIASKKSDRRNAKEWATFVLLYDLDDVVEEKLTELCGFNPLSLNYPDVYPESIHDVLRERIGIVGQVWFSMLDGIVDGDLGREVFAKFDCTNADEWADSLLWSIEGEAEDEATRRIGEYPQDRERTGADWKAWCSLHTDVVFEQRELNAHELYRELDGYVNGRLTRAIDALSTGAAYAHENQPYRDAVDRTRSMVRDAHRELVAGADR